MEKLSKKLVTLLALVTAQRVQTLAKIRENNLIISPERIQIKISDKLKTSGRNRTQPLLNLPFFKEQPRLCAGSALLVYLDRTKGLRSGTDDRVLLSIKKPYRPITSQTISRWVKDILTESGIDTTIFSAHSTRHASTSAAALKGISLDVIQNTAGWTERSSVFARFYHRPIINDREFAAAVIEKA